LNRQAIRAIVPSGEGIDVLLEIVAMATVSALGNLRHAARSESLGSRVFRAVLTLEAWLDRRRQRQALMELDDHILHDIGVSRADVESEAKKAFWQH
jgi:uncharacterized protein YjiS (DUF1127 family)